MAPGGRLYINGNRGNPYFKLPDRLTLQNLRFRIIQEAGPLNTRFNNLQFFRQTPRPNGSTDIPPNTVRTTVLEKY